MSSGSQETRAELLGELAREFRQFTGLGASFFRAAAEHLGLTVTDMQVMDLLESEDEATASQLADLVGLMIFPGFCGFRKHKSTSVHRVSPNISGLH
jgi:hypothetical protein